MSFVTDTIQILTGEPIASLTTKSFKIRGSYDWSVQLDKNGVNGNPKLTIEHSNNNVKFIPYSKTTEGIVLKDDTSIFFDDMFAAEYVRFTIDANGATTGTIDLSMLVNEYSQ